MDGGFRTSCPEGGRVARERHNAGRALEGPYVQGTGRDASNQGQLRIPSFRPLRKSPHPRQLAFIDPLSGQNSHIYNSGQSPASASDSLVTLGRFPSGNVRVWQLSLALRAVIGHQSSLDSNPLTFPFWRLSGSTLTSSSGGASWRVHGASQRVVSTIFQDLQNPH